MSDVHIREAQPHEWPALKALRLAGLRQSPDAFGSTLAGEQDQPDTFWIDRMSREDVTQLIASIDGRDVGVTVVGPSWDDEQAGGVFSVWVHPDARGHGVGDALMRHAILVARTYGYKKLLLEVGDENHHAISLYTRMGFVPTGRTTALDPPREHITEHERVLVL